METATVLDEQRVRDIVQQAFDGAELSHVERVPGSNNLGGVVVWSGFSGQAHVDRQRALWDALRGQLSKVERLHVGLLLTLTPRELAAILEED